MDPTMPNMFSLGLLSWAGKLRFPTLFVITAILFVINLLLIDPLPFVDELLFGLATLLLARWKKDRHPMTPVFKPKR